MPIREDLATCSFPEMRPEFGQPIRISRGFPRYPLKYPLPKEATLRVLWPGQEYFKAPIDEFNRRFLEDLDKVGVDRLEHHFARLKEEFQATRLVFLCFEQLWKDPSGEGCHRSTFADWWLTQTLETIPELGRTGDTPEVKEDEPTLM